MAISSLSFGSEIIPQENASYHSDRPTERIADYATYHFSKPAQYSPPFFFAFSNQTLGVTYERRDWVRARRELDAAAAAAPDNDVLFYNLGLILRRNGLLEDAIRSFERSEAINPRHIASLSHPRAADRVRELLKEQARIARVEQALAAAPALRGVPRGSSAYHRRLAELLEERSEPVAARGHRLRALELDATQTERQP